MCVETRTWLARVARAAGGCLLAWLLALAPVAAHEVPGQLRVHAFVKPEGERLQVLVRVPLELLANLNLPKRDDRLLDLPRVEPRLPAAAAALARDLRFFDGATLLVAARADARVAAAAEASFVDFDRARALLTGPRLPDTAEVAADKGYLDAYLEYPVRAGADAFALEFLISPGLRDRLKLDVRYVAPSGTVSAYEIATGAPRIELDPRWYQAAWTFVQAGFRHILDGVDHLLFLLCLVIPFRRIGWTLVGVVTAFTLAHSVTLIAAAYGLVPAGAWFPPLIETLIAVSILYMALENALRPNLQRRWVITFLFGLVHGFGFSFLLREQLQFAGSHLLVSLLAFNVGIELGQLLVLAIVVPVLVLVLGRVPLGERTVTVVLSVAIGLVAATWLVERLQALAGAGLPPALGWTLGVVLVLLAGAGLGARGVGRYWQRGRAKLPAVGLARPDDGSR